MLAAIAISGMSIISCMDDQYVPVPVKISDVNGNYRARLVTSKGINVNEKIIDFNAKDSLITFKDFPVREIVKTLVADPVKADTVLAHLGKVEYKIKFKSKLKVDQNVVELALEPQIMAFQIPVDGVSKDDSQAKRLLCRIRYIPEIWMGSRKNKHWRSRYSSLPNYKI